jgi:hypothetical protein
MALHIQDSAEMNQKWKINIKEENEVAQNK